MPNHSDDDRLGKNEIAGAQAADADVHDAPRFTRAEMVETRDQTIKLCADLAGRHSAAGANAIREFGAMLADRETSRTQSHG